jgi:hypothetical protein
MASSSDNDTIKETEENDREDTPVATTPSKTDSSCHNIADLSFDMQSHI